VDVGFLGSSDFDDERIATIASGVAFVVNSVDGELGGLVVLDFTVLDSFSGGIGSSGCARPFDLGVERAVSDVCTVESDIDCVCSGFLDLIEDRVSPVAIIGELGMGIFGTANLDFIRITSFLDVISIGIHRVNCESERMLGFSVGQTVAIGVGVFGVGILDQRAVGRSLDGLSVEGDVNLVASRGIGSVGALIGSILCVIELDHDGGAIGIFDGDAEVVSTSGNFSSVLVNGLDGEWGGSLHSGAFDTRSGCVRGLGIWTSDDWFPRRFLDLVSSEGDPEIVVSNILGDISARVGSVIVVDDADRDFTIGTSQSDVEFVTSSGEGIAEIIDGLDGERSGVVGGSSLKSWTVGIALRGISSSHLAESFGFDLSGSAFGIIQSPISEVRDVGHHGELVRAFVDIFGIHELGDIVFLVGGLDGSLEIGKGISGPLILREDTGLQRIGQSSEDLSVGPIHVEVVGPQAIGGDLFADPFEQFSLAFEASSLDLETEDESPDETQDELLLSVDDIFGADGDELNSLLLDELEGERHILELLRGQFRGLVVSTSNFLGRNDLQEVNKADSGGQIGGKVANVHLSVLQEVVGPSGEGLLLDGDPGTVADWFVLLFRH